MARINGSGFKMKQSPTKGKLDDFFSSLGSQLRQGQKERGIFSEAGKAEKKSRKAGESKFQADARRRKETRKTAKPEKTSWGTSDPNLNVQDPKSEITVSGKGPDYNYDFGGTPPEAPAIAKTDYFPENKLALTSKNYNDLRSSGRIAQIQTSDGTEGRVVHPNIGKGEIVTFSGKPGDKYKYRTYKGTGHRSYRTAGKGDLRYEFQRPGSDVWEKSDGKSTTAIEDLYYEDYEGQNKTYTPIQKKSPYKKGLGSYAKKAKGNRGYKMKRK